VVIVAVAGAAVWLLGHRGAAANGGTGQPTHAATSPAASGVKVIPPLSAHGFDALSSPADDPQNENDQLAKFAIDSNPATFWNTQFYFNNPAFGGLKTGTGLILDMGKPVKLASVQIKFGAIPGADVQIEVGNNNTRASSTLSSFTTVAQATGVGGTYTFTVHSHATGRYVLIWFTKLPPKAGAANRFEARIYNIVVRGSS
jgi:hypothetical protein